MALINRTTRLRFRRRVRRSRRRVEDMGYQAEDQFERHLIRRLTRLFDVRRFIAGWLGLLIILGIGVTLQTQALSGYYQTLQPIPGGSHTEGMVGSFTNANPLYATSITDTSVSHLIFAGLLKYDDHNQLVGDLAESWEVGPEGKIYTVTLKPGLTWHDGKPLTTSDVVFTYQTAQNADAKSPLFYGLQGVKVQAVDEITVTFTLTNTLAPFIYSLTTGIVPRHSLENTNPAQLRSSPFNTTHPIGAGPFMWDTIELAGNVVDSREQHIGLKAFHGYHGSAPKLQRFVINTYSSEDQLVQAFKGQKVNAIVGLDRVPDGITSAQGLHEYTAPLTAASMVFFNTESDYLKDARVRQALVQAVDVPTVINGLSYPVVAVDEPLLRKQVGYDPALKQLPVNIDQANKLLDDAGWKRPSPDKPRSNGTDNLHIKLYAHNNADYAYITQKLQKAWQTVGVEVEVQLADETDLQSSINNRAYDALLYGISLGTDPDVFAYWHSTQTNPLSASRLNFSNYKSKAADAALEAGRSRIEPSLRAAKYKPFLAAWRSDAPALALYQPRFLYITRGQLFGFEPTTINSAADRFANVQNWMVREAPTVKSN
jgi:peptide/nickel transport system substrate-binding protein